MRLFIMRHAEAELFAESDDTRSLTAHGHKQAYRQGEWLKTHLKSTALSLSQILVSPYRRAQETFEQLNLAFNQTLQITENWKEITPYGKAELVVDYLSYLKQEKAEGVLLISHLPLVAEIVAELYGKRNPINFYPATIVELDWSDKKYADIITFNYSSEIL